MFDDIDFSTLSLQDALDLAILIEDEARDRYEEFAAQMRTHHSPEAEEFFRFMAHNEARHGDQLREQRRERWGDAPSRIERSMIWDVEAPDHDQPRAFMTAKESLEVALRSEQKAHDYFAKAVRQTSDPDVKALFQELREEELQHQVLLREHLARLPDEVAFDADDFVDPPRGL